MEKEIWMAMFITVKSQSPSDSLRWRGMMGAGTMCGGAYNPNAEAIRVGERASTTAT